MSTATSSRRRLWDSARGLAFVLVVGVPALLPVGYVVLHSFSDTAVGEALHLSLAPWARAFSTPKTVDAILTSFVLAVRVPLAMLVALWLAWLLVRVDLPGRRLIMYGLWFSFFLPILPMTVGWILLADRDFGLLNQALRHLPLIDHSLLNVSSIPGIIWVHLSLSTVPIMTILLAPALQQVDSSYEEASDLAGAGVATTLRRITLPLIAPAILTAFLAGLIKSLEVFEVEQLLGIPAGIFVYSTRVYNLLRTIPPDYPQSMALSSLFLGFLLLVALAYLGYLRRYEVGGTLAGRGVRARRRHRTRGSYLVSALLLLGLALTVGLPFVVLLLGSFTKLFGFFFIHDPWTARHWVRVFSNPSFLTAARNSLVVSLSSAALGTLAFALLGWVLVRTRVWGRQVVSLLAWLPWAIPGVLLGTAFLSLFLGTPFLSSLLTTLVPMTFVLIVQSLPLGTHMLRSAVAGISAELEEASHMAGASPLTTFRRISLPLVMPTFVSVFVLVFMSAMKDISATVLLAAPGTRTLPLLMFEYASSGTAMESAVVIGVLTAGFALVVTAVAFRMGAKFSITA
jgi:iron(III) transport system permease protein